jgi:hypothetical protein
MWHKIGRHGFLREQVTARDKIRRVNTMRSVYQTTLSDAAQ